MIELSEQNVIEYLRKAGHGSDGEILVQSLSGGIANVVLKIFDTGAGQKVGSDIRSPAQKKLSKTDLRPTQGETFVLKQPLPKFRTEAEWIVDVDRVKVERDCMILLTALLPAGSVPQVLWFDEPNNILAMSAAPLGAVIWKKDLLAGHASIDAATHAGMLLAMLHSSTKDEADIRARYGDPHLFLQQRVDPYLHGAATKNPAVASQLNALGEKLLAARFCLIHGDFSPKNIFLIPREEDPDENRGEGLKAKSFPLSHLMLLDFEVAFYGHPAFDVATLINHLLLKGFLHHTQWRPFMLMADNFWQTYRHTADPDLVRAVEGLCGPILGALLLARIDGKSPAEYLLGNEPVRSRVRQAALAILTEKDTSLDRALDTASSHFEAPGPPTWAARSPSES